MESREDKFTKIWRDGVWGHPKSGAYALPQYTQTIRGQLPRIFRQYKIASVFDAPCGDFTWMCNVLLDDVRYIGGDIVRPMVRDLQHFHGLDFRCHDLIRHPFPKDVDLWFCRDFLYMLSVSEIARAFWFARKARVKYFMFTSHYNRMNVIGDPNVDRQQNLCISPFNFPEPLEWVDDWCDDVRRPGLIKRRMGLWGQEQLEGPMSSIIERCV